LSIIIPRRMNEVTAFQCTLCPAEFYEDERHQYERHVLNHPTEDLVPHSPRLQAPALFGDAGGDRDWNEWVNRHRESDPHGWERWGRTDDGKSSSGLGDG
jgi:hypothetical protein